MKISGKQIKISQVLFFCVLIFIVSCKSKPENSLSDNYAKDTTTLLCSDECMTKDSKGELKCKMTTEELQLRRERVIGLPFY